MRLPDLSFSKLQMATRRERRATIYVDIEALIQYLRVRGANVISEYDGTTHAHTLYAEVGGKRVQVFVPLVPYDPRFQSISTTDLQRACDMSLVTLPPYKYKENLYDADLGFLVHDFIRLVSARQEYKSIYEIVRKTGGDLKVSTLQETIGPKGAATVTVSLTVGDATVAHVVCTGKGYNVICKEQRFAEALLKEAPLELSKKLLYIRD